MVTRSPEEQAKLDKFIESYNHQEFVRLGYLIEGKHEDLSGFRRNEGLKQEYEHQQLFIETLPAQQDIPQYLLPNPVTSGIVHGIKSIADTVLKAGELRAEALIFAQSTWNESDKEYDEWKRDVLNPIMISAIDRQIGLDPDDLDGVAKYLREMREG